MPGKTVTLNVATDRQHRPGDHVTHPACGVDGDFCLALFDEDRPLCQRSACYGGE